MTLEQKAKELLAKYRPEWSDHKKQCAVLYVYQFGLKAVYWTEPHAFAKMVKFLEYAASKPMSEDADLIRRMLGYFSDYYEARMGKRFQPPIPLKGLAGGLGTTQE